MATLKALRAAIMKPGDVYIGVVFPDFKMQVPIQKTKWLDDLATRFDAKEETGLKLRDDNCIVTEK